MRGDYVVVIGGDSNAIDEYSRFDNAKIVAEYTRGYVIDMSTQEIVFDCRKKKDPIPSELDKALGLFQQSIGCAIDAMNCFPVDPELVQLKIAARKLSVLINKYCNKE